MSEKATMHRPSACEILKEGESYYSLVIGVAKRAREIAEEAEEEGRILIDKPVQIAVEEFAAGEFYLKEKEDLGTERESPPLALCMCDGHGRETLSRGTAVLEGRALEVLPFRASGDSEQALRVRKEGMTGACGGGACGRDCLCGR